MKSSSIKVAYLGLHLAVNILLARSLSPAEFGIYIFGLTIAQLASVVAQLGLPTSLVKVVATRLSEGHADAILGDVQTGVAMVLVAGGGIGVTLYAVHALGIFETATPVASVLLPSLLLTLALAVSAAVSGGIKGCGNYLLGQVPDELVRPASLFLLVLSASFLAVPFTAGVAMQMHLAAALLAAVTSVWILHSKRGYPVAVRVDARNALALARVSVPFLALSGVQALNYQLDVLMVASLIDAEALGYYRVAWQIAEGFSIVIYGMSISIMAQVVGLHRSGEHSKLQAVLVSSHRVVTALTIPAAACIVLYSAPILAAVFGAEYVPAKWALTLLVIGKVAFATVGLSGMVLSMTGHAWSSVKITLGSLAVNLAMGFSLIPFLGIEGAAIATGVSQIGAAVLSALEVRKQLGIEVSAFNLEVRNEHK
jgi:O-antigen/teichoic acid export membrane protein